MANYMPVSRTNYFKVKNLTEFHNAMSKIVANDLEVWEKEIDGETYVAFGGFDSFIDVYIWNEENEDGMEEGTVDIATIIQPHLADGEGCIILESGYEKLRYIVGSAYIITQEKTEYVDLEQVAIKKTMEMLGVKEKKFYTTY